MRLRLLTFTTVLLFSLCLGARAAGPLPACEHVAAPLEVLRFEAPLKSLREFLPPDKVARGAKPEALDPLIDAIVEKDARGLLFKLEGLLRIYDGIYGGALKKLRVDVKRAEDLVGWYSEKLEYLDYARKIEAPGPVVEAMGKVRDASKGELYDGMPEFPETLDRLQAELGKVDWERQRDDRVSVMRELARELKKYERLDYDMTDLQGGIHELRRNLRWILIYIQALDGLMVLEKGVGRINEYSYLEGHPIAKSKFSKVEPNPRVKKPVQVPVEYFLALSKLVQEIGVIKSSAENVEAVAGGYFEAARESGKPISHKKALKMARDLARENDPDFVEDPHAAARQSLKELKRTGLLRKLRKWVEDEVGI
ncbi:MAG: hypothetical protein HY075_00850 [Deltaproteobacteria bacterium]|nr:hypothetical protein [Deltaproteobacteria bacterium]